MQKTLSLLFGLGLVLVGLLALGSNLALTIFGLNPGLWIAARIWPLMVIGVGLLFALPPLLSRTRALGVLFIPGLPILTTGGILLFVNTTGLWRAWSYLWPLEVLALAAGFLLAAAFLRSVWLTLPAIVIGLNGLVLLFCAVTGLWETWAVLWTVEPLALGLMLLVTGAATRSTAVTIVGLAFCGFAGMAFTGISAIVALSWWPMRLIGPGILIVLGAALLLWGLLRAQSTQPTTSSLQEQA
jgi:hypothetical protein